jgi:hypothetical protein
LNAEFGRDDDSVAAAFGGDVFSTGLGALDWKKTLARATGLHG